MAKLCQVIAVSNGKKSKAAKAMSKLESHLRAPIFDGLTRTYRPKDDEGERLPSEEKKVQHSVRELVSEAFEDVSEMFDVVLSQDRSNQKAGGEIRFGKDVSKVPVSTLLFLEKQLAEIHKVISGAPTLASSEDWQHSSYSNSYKSKTTETTRTKKVPFNHVKAEATKEHPAQVEVYTEDVVVGYWETTKFSGALSLEEKKAILDRIEFLQDATKAAREEANSIEAEDCHWGEKVLGWILEGDSTSSS